MDDLIKFPSWQQRRDVFHQYLNLQKFDFHVDEKLYEKDFYGIRYFKKSGEYIFSFNIGFLVNDINISVVFSTLYSDQIQKSIVVANTTDESEDYNLLPIVEFGAFPALRLVFRNFNLFSEKETAKEKNYKISYRIIADRIIAELENTIIPFMNDWADLKKIHHELIIPLCVKKEKVYGIQNWDDLIGARYFYTWFPIFYTMNKFSNSYLETFIKEYIDIFKAKEKEEYARIMNITITYLRYLGVKYDFSEVEKEL